MSYSNVVVGSCPNSLTLSLLAARESNQPTALVPGRYWGEMALELPCANFDRGLRQRLELPSPAPHRARGRGLRDRAGRQIRLSPSELDGPDLPGEDRKRWPHFVAEMETAVSLLRTAELRAWEELTQSWQALDRRRAAKALRLPWLSLRELLGLWFCDPVLQGGLAATALVGSRLGPFDPGSAYLLLLRWSRGEVLEPEAAPRDELQAAVEASSVTVVDGRIERYLQDDEKVIGVELEGGQKVLGQQVWTNQDPHTVVRRLDRPPVSPTFTREVQGWHQRCSAVTASGLAQSPGAEPTPPAVWTLADSLEQVQRAVDPCQYGQASESPFAEWNPHTGQLLACHASAEGRFNLSALCEEFGLPDSASVEVRSASVRAQRYGLERGHLYGGETSLWQTQRLRERFQVPAPGLRLMGASTAPGDYSGRSGAAAIESGVASP